jgi:transcriptional regulator with XRE-family HTH domain
MYNELVAQKIRLARESMKPKRMTQAQLGSLLNVTQTAVYHWEAGDCIPDFDTIASIAKVVDRDIAWFFEPELKEESSRESIPTSQNQMLNNLFYKILDRQDKIEGKLDRILNILLNFR